jgi:hypothetical protein
MSNNPDDNEILLGAKAIGREAGIFKDDGTVDLRKTYYGLEQGYIPARKYGRREWQSTKSQIRKRFQTLSTV